LTPAATGPAKRQATLIVADAGGVLHRAPFTSADPRPIRLSCPA